MYQRLLEFQDSKFWKTVHGTNGIFLTILGILAVACIFATVIARYIFKTDLYGMEEIILVIAFWLYFVGGANGSLEDNHIKADLIDVFVKNQVVMYRIKALAKFIEGITLVVFSNWSINLVILNAQRMPKTPGLKIPYIVSQAPIAIGFVLMAFFALYYCALFFTHAEEIKRKGGI